MRAFTIEALRAVLVWWSRTWRRIIRTRRNLFIFAGSLLMALVVSSVVLSTANPAKPRPVEEAPSAAPTIPYTEVQATPLAAGAPSPSSTKTFQMGDGPQAAPGNTAPAVPSHAPKEIPEPTKPKVDMSNQESVAKGFATAYLSRPREDWNDWTEWVRDYTTPELVSQLKTLAFHDKSPLSGKTPTRVSDVKILPAEKGSGVDTPIRWSRNLEVSVESADGTLFVVTYAAMLSKSEKGWVVTEAVEMFWTVK